MAFTSDEYHKCKLQMLAERTWDLHGRINQSVYSFCANCSNQGRYCVVADNNTLKEEQKLMLSIKDSLKDVYTNLLHLQRVKSSQDKHRDEALARLEESRKLVIDMMNQFPEKQRKLGVLEELTSFLGDEKIAFSGKLEEKVEQKSFGSGITRFLVSTTRFAIEFAVIFASIYSTAKLYKSTKQGNCGDPIVSTVTRNADHFTLDDSTVLGLDVLRGMG